MRISLSSEQTARLQQIVRQPKGEARLHRRAKMVLLAASGESIASIARRAGTNRLRVGQWLRSFAEHGVDGLRDQPRSGRPPELTALERHQVVAAACQSPRQLGVERDLWSHEALAQALMEQDLVRTGFARGDVRNHLDSDAASRSCISVGCTGTFGAEH